MADTVNSVKIEVKADAKNAVEALNKVISAATKLRDTLLRDNGSAKMSREIANAFKSSGSAIDAQISKIASLKSQLNELSSLYKRLNSDRAKVDNAERKQSTTFEGTKEYQKARDQVAALRASLRETTSEVKELFGGTIPTNSQFEEAILRLKLELKDAENGLKELQKEENGSSKTAKSSASSHKSFSTALAKVEKTAKKIKRVLSNIVGGFKSMASSIKGAIPGANKFGGALGKLASQFKRLFVMRILRNAISAMIKGFQEGIQNIAKYSAALNNLDANHANQTMSELASTALYLKNTLGSAAIPVLNAILPVIRAIATAFATAVNYVNQFISALGGKSSWTRAKQVTVDYASSLGDVGSSAGSAKDAVEDLKRTILGFDEINKLNDASSSSGGSGGGSGGGGSDSVNVEDMFEEVPIDNKVTQWLKDLKPYIDAIKDAWGDVKRSVKELVDSKGFKYLVGTGLKMALTGIFTLLETAATLIGNVKDALDDPEIQGRIWTVKEAWDDVRKAITDLVNSPAWQSVVEAVTFIGLTTITGLLETISGLINGIQDGIEELDKKGKIEELKKAWDDVTHAVSDLFNAEGFQALESTALYMFVTGITGVLDTIKSIIEGSVIPALNELAQDGTFSEMADSWDRIWDNIKSIAESEAFKTLVSDGVKVTVESIATALDTIANALQIINGLLTGDLGSSIKGLAKLIINALEIPGNIVTSLLDKINEIRGQHTNNYGVWQSTTAAAKYAIDNDVPYMDAYEITGGVNTRTGSKDNSELFLGQFVDKYKKIVEEWKKLPDNERGLEFVAYLTDNSKEIAEWYKTKPWNNVSADEKELAFKAYIDTLPQTIASQYKDRSWDTLPDSDRVLAWAAYISSKASTVANNYQKEWNKTDHDLPFGANVEEGEAIVGDWRDEEQGTVMNVPVEARMTKAKLAAQQFRNSVNTTTATVPIDANTTSADTKYNTYKGNAEKTLTSPVDANTSKANTAYNTWKGVVDKGTTAPVAAEMKTSAKTLYGTVTSDWQKNITAPGLKLPTETEITTWASTMWKDVDTRWAKDNGADDKHTFPIYSEIATWASTMWNDIEGRWNSATANKSLSIGVDATLNSYDIKRQAKEAFTDITVAVTGAGDLNKIAGNLYFQARAMGGIISPMSFVDSAQLFMARENGIPEYVGRFGSQSAVANNYQITEGIALGVQRATAQQNELLREQNSLLREIASKSGNTSVSSILGAMNRVNKRTGTPVVQMG